MQHLVGLKVFMPTVLQYKSTRVGCMQHVMRVKTDILVLFQDMPGGVACWL